LEEASQFGLIERIFQMNDASLENNLAMYFKIIDYKRSIGITQWTVLSIFLTVSEAILVFGLTQSDNWASTGLLVFGVFVYWLGFLLYNRYRNLNRQVAGYLVELETNNSFKFQQKLNEEFHRKGLSTKNILTIGGFLYLLLVIIMILVTWR
jgi:hypothetical protein